MSSATWNGQPKCRLCLPWKKFWGRPYLCYLCLQSNICIVLRCIPVTILCYSSTLCSSLSVSVTLNVRFTTNGVCSKTYNHIYVARTNEDLSPYTCNVCEFLGTNYCTRMSGSTTADRVISESRYTEVFYYVTNGVQSWPRMFISMTMWCLH